MNIQRARRTGRRGSDRPAVSRDVSYKRLGNPYQPQPLYSDDQIEQLHQAALRVLAETGIRVLLPRARAAYRAAGCIVDDDSMMVQIGAEVIDQAIASAPSSFELLATAPENNIHLGGNSLNFMPVGGPPGFSDLDRGKQTGTRAAVQNFIRLCQHFDVMHVSGPCVEAQDLPLNERHLWVSYDNLTLANKPIFTWARGTPVTRDGFEMIRIARGLSEDEFRAGHHTFTVINTNSPLQLDIPMLNGLMDFAEANQIVVITPFTLAGAMAPVTIAGALVLQHAEFLAALVINQLTRPGAPVVYGAFTSNVDMKSGSPAFGTPEYVKACWGAGQLARKLKLPWRSSAPTASNVADAQGAYETQLSLWGAIQGGANMVAHTAGWLEGGLTASFEKFVLDIEVAQMIAELCQPVKFDEDELAVSAIAEVGPGGHFFGCQHTMERYATAFYKPLVSDWSNFGQWSENGSLTATQRANRLWKQIVADFVPPQQDEAAREALGAHVRQRIEAGGALPES
jgi:trimethylamine---corrinoid protein Co-methyltransferase